MSKYNIEGGIDFFSELYNSLDIEENNQKIEEDNNLCLITNQPLLDKYVKLECGHKFNYIPLFNDIKNHKQKFNNLEGCNSKLKTNEIRCPYCRYKQNGVLPYYEELNIQKINGTTIHLIEYNTELILMNQIIKQNLLTHLKIKKNLFNILYYHHHLHLHH
jgi:DNA-directed RNA polymerase subunit RPC12/RpoP